MVEGVSGWQGLVGWFAGIVEGVAAKVASAFVWKIISWVGRSTWHPFRNKIRRYRDKGNVPVRSQLRKFVTSSLDGLDRADIVGAIQQTEALREVRNTLYRTDDVHWRRRFRWNRLIDGSLQLTEDACLKMRQLIGLSGADVGFAVTEKNQWFANRASLGALKDGRIITARHDEGKDLIDAEWTISPSGARVAILETIIYSNRILIKAINYLRKEGAESIGVWALFDARCEHDSESLLDEVPINAAYTVDLGLVNIQDIEGKKVIMLRYKEQ